MVELGYGLVWIRNFEEACTDDNWEPDPLE
jgi:hypothetical protein